jgi:2-polyprenyl-3-methyl-5-hydroxy-6-metoxy-1,4-benzoquinol methylase
MNQRLALGNAPDQRSASNNKAFALCPLCEGTQIACRYETLNIWRCRQCGLIFRNPQPHDDDLSRLYSNSYSGESIATGTTQMEMAGTSISLARSYVRSLSRTLELKGKQILDFGAGLGTMSMALRELGAQVIAVEPFGWRECEKAGIRSYRSLSELPRTARFDLVVAIQVVEHLPLPWVTLKELGDLLKPGGWLHLGTPNSNGLNARVCRRRWREFLKPTHLMFFNPDTLERTLEKAGFERLVRLKALIRYSDNPAKRVFHTTLQLLALGGELRYLAQKS